MMESAAYGLASARIYANLALRTLHLEGVNGMTWLMLCLSIDELVSEFNLFPGRELESIRPLKMYETVLLFIP